MIEKDEEIIIEDERGVYNLILVGAFALILMVIADNTYKVISSFVLVTMIMVLGYFSYKEICKPKNRIRITQFGCEYNDEFFLWENIYFVSKSFVTGFEFKAYVNGQIFHRSVFVRNKSPKKIIDIDLFSLIKSKIESIENTSDFKKVNFSRTSQMFVEMSVCSSITFLIWFIGVICTLKYSSYYNLESKLDYISALFTGIFILFQLSLNRWDLSLEHFEFKTKLRRVLIRAFGALVISFTTTYFVKEVVFAYNFSKVLSTRTNTFSIYDFNYVKRTSKYSTWFVYETKFKNEQAVGEKYTFDLHVDCIGTLKLGTKVDFSFYRGRLGLEFLNPTSYKSLIVLCPMKKWAK